MRYAAGKRCLKSPKPGAIIALAAGVIICQLSAFAAPGEHSGRFAGLWLIDQPFHALYEATLYRFNDTGSIDVLAQSPSGYQTGTICSTSTDAACALGGEWYSRGADTLCVMFQCGARGQRIGTFVFVDSSHSNCSNPEIWCGNPVAIAVQQDTAWRHCDFEWRWIKCVRSDYYCFRSFGTSVSANGLNRGNPTATKRTGKIEFANLNGRIIAPSQAARGNHIVIQKITYIGGGQNTRVVYSSGPGARSNRH